MSGQGSSTNSLQWRPDIQGLRAIAVGLVILAHAGFPGFAAGAIGVDVFFVISGFLITGLLIAESEKNGRISIGQFYARRARRILPAATTVAVATLVACWLLEPLAVLRQHAVDAAWSAAFMANVRFAIIDADYWATDELSPFRHYWSLSVEEQFYVVWPLLLGLFILRRSRPVVWVGAVALASLAFSVWHTAGNPLQAYYSAPARAYELLIGALVAVALPALRELAPWLRNTMALAGVATLAGSMLLLDAESSLPGWVALAPTLAAAALLASGAGAGNTAVGWALSRQPLRYLGDISYSLYLWHWPVLVLAPSVASVAALSVELRTLVMLSITLVLSVLSYHFIERPIMTWNWLRPRARRSILLWPASVAVVVTASVVTVSAAQAEFETQQRAAAEFERQNPELTQQQSAAAPQQGLKAAVRAARKGAPIPAGLNLAGLKKDVWFKNIPNNCQAWWDKSKVKTCKYGNPKAKRTVVLLGDSHAGMWLPSLDALGKKQNFRVIPLVKHACSPYNYRQTLGGKSFQSCADFRTWSRAKIRSIKPDAVVVTARGYQEIKPARGQSKDQAWTAGATDTLKRLRKNTKRVIVLSDLPSRPSEPASCVTKRGATQRTCLAKSSGTRETKSNVGTKRAAKAARVRYVNLVPMVCHDGACPVVVNKKFVYFDDDHMTRSWGIRVSDDVGKALGKLY